MTILDAALFWASTFAQVFLLGFQSRNVNSGRYVSAALTSLAIGAAQLVVIRSIATFDPVAIFALTGTAGPLGITAAMAVSHHAYGRRKGGK